MGGIIIGATAVLAAILSLLPTTAAIQVADDPVADFRGRVCGSIANGVTLRGADVQPNALTGSTGQYLYEVLIYDAAGVTASDSYEQAVGKIQQFWNATGRNQLCRDTRFIAGGGNLIKYGAHRNRTNFIDDVIRWEVDLNEIDAADGRTALDYIHDERIRLEGTNRSSNLEMYLNMLRRAGARYRVEIDGVDCRVSAPQGRHRSCPAIPPANRPR